MTDRASFHSALRIIGRWDYGVIVKGKGPVLLKAVFATSTWTVPGDAIADAGTAAVTVFALTKVVGSAEPLNSTTEDEVNRAPLTVSVKAAPPAAALLGESELIKMEPTGNIEMFDLRFGGLTTDTCRIVSANMKEAGTTAVNCAGLTNVVCITWAFTSTVDDGPKPLPFTVSVRVGCPAMTLSGESVPTTGVTGAGVGVFPPQPANEPTEMSPATARATACL